MSVGARWAIVAVGLLESAVIYFHVLGIEQTRYWRWSFRNDWFWPLYPALIAAAVPMAAGVWIRLRLRRAPALPLLLIACSVFLIQPIALIIAYHPADVTLPTAIVEDRYDSSYWYDARRLARQHLTVSRILHGYPQLLPGMYVHSRNKPPGFVLFYWVLMKGFGTDSGRSALVGAAVIAAGTAAAVFAVYALAGELLGDADAAFWAALLFALTPAVLGMFPQFDSCFAAIACVLLWLWLRALRTTRVWPAISLGALLAIALFFTSNLLVLGTLMLALVEWERQFGRPNAWTVAIRSAAWIAGIVLVLYLGFDALTGYQPLVTARTYAGIEYQFEHHVSHRPWPWIVPSDFFHFAFGTGRMLILLAAAALLLPVAPRQRWAVRLCLSQILFVGCTGLLRGETTRLWIFLMPLLVIPAGLVLEHWPLRWRLAVIAVLFLFALVMLQNVELNMRPLPFS